VLTEAAKKTKKVTKKKAMVREAKNEPVPEDEDGDPRGEDLRNRLTGLWSAGGKYAEGLDTTQGSGMPMLLPRSAIKSGRGVERELKQQAAEEERQVYTQELEMRYPTSESFLDGANYENQFVLGRLKKVRSRFDNRKWEAEFTLHEKRMRLMSRLHRTNHRTKGIRRKNNSSSSSRSRSKNTTTNLNLNSRVGGRSAGGATGGPLHILTDGQSVLQRVDPWEGAGSPQSPESPPHGRVTIFNADPHRKSKSRHMAVRIGAGGAGRSSGRGGGGRDRPALTSEVTALATMLTGVHMRSTLDTLADTRSGMSGDMGGAVKKTKRAKKKKKKGGLQTGWRDGGEGVREGGGADGVGGGEEDVNDGVASVAAAAAAAAVPLLAAAGLYTRGS
jgi:hypothetical protein